MVDPVPAVYGFKWSCVTRGFEERLQGSNPNPTKGEWSLVSPKFPAPCSCSPTSLHTAYSIILTAKCLEREYIV